MKTVAIIVAALLTGCSVAPQSREAIERAGELVDTVIDEGRAAFCSGSFSKRAYEDFMRRHGMTRAELIAWCNWDKNEIVNQDG